MSWLDRWRKKPQPDAPSAGQTPLALKVVAGLFIAGAVLDAIKLIAGLAGGSLSLQLGIIGFWIGPGLLLHERKWLKWGKTLLWIDLIVVDLVGVVMTFAHNEPQISFWTFDVPSIVPRLFLVGMGLLSFWQLRVLSRPDIDELFDDEEKEQRRQFQRAPVILPPAPIPTTLEQRAKESVNR